MTMASTCNSFHVFPVMVICMQMIMYVGCTEFQVGGDDGWAVPKSKNDVYNQWASHNRFKVNDTVHFKYEKDSVLEVTEEDYEKCHSTRPIFFSNNGNTVVTVDRAGLFYFISGISGHCEKGQKMIIKVLEPANPPQSSANGHTSAAPASTRSSGAVDHRRQNSVNAFSCFLLILVVWFLEIAIPI